MDCELLVLVSVLFFDHLEIKKAYKGGHKGEDLLGGTLWPFICKCLLCLNGIEGAALESPLKSNQLLKEVVMNDNDRKTYLKEGQ